MFVLLFTGGHGQHTNTLINQEADIISKRLANDIGNISFPSSRIYIYNTFN